MRAYQIPLYTLLLLLALAGPALAVDGVLEINQTCAISTGCFPGDSPGFPVSVTQPGSYRLTGNLDLSAEGVNVSGIAVSVSSATIDLGGFYIAGPTSCSGSGTSINCSPSSTGVGSAGVHFSSNAVAGVVHNGIVRNMTNFGILSQATGLRVKDITAIHNGRDGITGNKGSLVVNCVAIENGQDGIDVNTASVVDGVTSIGNGRHGVNGQGTGSVATRTSAQQNAMKGFSLGLLSKFGQNNVPSGNGEADLCGGGICTSLRRYYMSISVSTGGGALNLCATGFHFASMWELINPSVLAYDTRLGHVEDDSGSGPPGFQNAWVRNGRRTASDPGILGNCFLWTSDTLGTGSVSRLTVLDQDGVAPSWSSNGSTCDSVRPAWCIEDL